MKLLGPALLALLALTACNGPIVRHPITGGERITIYELHDEPFEASHGDQIDVIMLTSGDPLARCNHMGGKLIVRPRRTICQDVDF